MQHNVGGGEADPSAEGESARNSPGQMLSAAVGRGGKRSKTGSRAGSPGGSSLEDSIARDDQTHSQVCLVLITPKLEKNIVTKYYI